MALMKHSSEWVSYQLLSVAPDVEFRKTLDAAAEIYNSAPEIEAAIRRDQDRAAVEKRRLRDADRQWRLSHTDMLSSEFEVADLDELASRPLEIGCPRMSPLLVFVMVLFRGRWGSVTDQRAYERLRDSITLRLFLEAHGMKLPGRSTIHENINVVSEETLELILLVQLRSAFKEGLDDFRRLFQDSTAVEANSRWPTDSGNLSRALHRAYHYGRNLKVLGLPSFRSWTMPRWLRRIRRIDFEINTASGKPAERQKKMRKLYREQVALGDKLIEKLSGELEWVVEQYAPERFAPSRRALCEETLSLIRQDCQDASILICNIEERVFEGKKLKSWQRLPSLSDKSASFICKGDRVPVVGYRPQLVRSGNGFVVHMAVPEGNASDSSQLVQSIDAAIRRVLCIPDAVSTDDGYASAAGYQALRELGIRVVSISGSKGKRLTPSEEWDSPEYQQARNDRSAVESLMFSLKFTVEFGRVRRRGIKAVRTELLEKVIAYNFMRIVLLRERKKSKLPKCA